MNTHYSSLFYKIKEIANEKHITISYIERKCGLANGTIGKWKNRSIPQIDSLKKVATFLNTTLDYLTSNEEEK